MERNKRERPFVVCHMLASLDGKIDGDFFGAVQAAPAQKAYEEIRGCYDCQATLYGTTTMLGGYADGQILALPKGEGTSSKEDYIHAEGRAVGNFIVSVDPKGILRFSSSVLEKKGRPAAHIIEALTEQAAPDYTAYLRKKGISYLFAGKDRLDCALLLQKLVQQFGIRRLMIAGGGVVNWSFLQEGLIDRLSLVIAPVADGNTASVSIFEQAGFLPPHGPVAFRLQEAKSMEGSVLWLQYIPLADR